MYEYAYVQEDGSGKVIKIRLGADSEKVIEKWRETISIDMQSAGSKLSIVPVRFPWQRALSAFAGWSIGCHECFFWSADGNQTRFSRMSSTASSQRRRRWARTKRTWCVGFVFVGASMSRGLLYANYQLNSLRHAQPLGDKQAWQPIERPVNMCLLLAAAGRADDVHCEPGQGAAEGADAHQAVPPRGHVQQHRGYGGTCTHVQPFLPPACSAVPPQFRHCCLPRCEATIL
jgi:hypothetical protein